MHNLVQDQGVVLVKMSVKPSISGGSSESADIHPWTYQIMAG